LLSMGMIEDIAAKLGLKDSKQLMLVAGGAAVVGVLLLTSKSKKAGSSAKAVGSKADCDLDSKEGVLQVLKEMTTSQVQSRKQMKELATEAQTKSLSLSQACKRCNEMKVMDPLDKYNLSMVQFNTILSKHEDDPAVKQAITSLMGSPAGGVAATEASQTLNAKKLIEIHNFMLGEFEKLAASDKGSRDAKTVTFAAQALVTGKTEAAFKLSSEDIESAVLAQQGALSTSPEFCDTNLKLQQAMSKLMGNLA